MYSSIYIYICAITRIWLVGFIVRKFGVSWAIDQEISGHPIFQTSCHINWNLQIPPSCRCVDVCDLPI